MVRQKKIELTIPTIDLSLAKRIKGGYILYGGELEASFCVADGPGDNYPNADDGWTPDINPRDPRDFEDYDFSQDNDGNDSDFSIIQDDDYGYSQHEGVQHDGGLPGPDENLGALSKDSLVSDGIVSQLLAGSGVDYQFNQDWLDEKSLGSAIGATIYAGQSLPDGSIAEHDTIVLSPDATVATVNEELFHIWQGANCYNGDGFPTDHSTGPMELMAAIFDYIYDIQFGNGKYGDENDDKYLPNQLWILLEGLVSVSGDEFDFNGFLKEWNDSYFEDWKAFYRGKGYGHGNLDDWDWKWEDAYEWWMNTWGQQ